ncbi:MAG: VCBS repeat-containing protein [Bryobacteraceae bacterium]|nr:VCBS repeat-containing protein [Bryobacteraceae bacterium]
MVRALLAATLAATCFAAEIHWTFLSSQKGDLPNPGGSNQQTGLLVAQLDRGKAAGLVISYRVSAPALVWMRREAGVWKRHVIEPEFLKLEAGGASHDIDGDGDNDIVFGGDGQDRNLWWWENPYPNFRPDVPWKRRAIKSSGANQHHDQAFGDFTGAGRPQLAFWNQKAKTLFLAPVPADPRNAGEWPREPVFSGQAGEDVDNAARYAEGAHAFDVDGDGRQDLLAGNSWFKHLGGGRFQTVRVGSIGGRIQAGRFRRGKLAQIVIAPGDGSGPLRFYECPGDAANSNCWKGRNLLDRDMTHGHTLDVGDIDGDGNLDIFAAEMAKWTRGADVDHPGATAWILYGDGKGAFRKTVLVTGHGWHEGKLADVDGDGDLDVVNKPYTWQAPRLDVWLNNGTRGEREANQRRFE